MRHLMTMRQLCVALAVAALAVLAVPAGAQAYPGEECPHPTFGGTFYCDYKVRTHTFSNGTYEAWVIGTDWNVWTRWKNSSGVKSDWVNQGGDIDDSYDPADFRKGTCSNGQPYLQVKSGGLWKSKIRNTNGTWTGWLLWGNVKPC